MNHDAELFYGGHPTFYNVILDSLEMVTAFNRHRLNGTLSEFQSSFGALMDEDTFLEDMTTLAIEREKLINHLIHRRLAPSMYGLTWWLAPP